MHDDSTTASGVRGSRHAWAPRHVAEPTKFRSESGQASVEFGLVVPLVCFLVWVLVEFGLALNYYLDATHLANEGARLAAVLGNTTEPGGNFKSWVQQQALTTELRDGTGSVTQPARVCVTFLPGPTNTTGQIGDPVEVTVTAQYHWIPFIGGADFDINSSSTMRLEQLPAYSQGCYPA